MIHFLPRDLAALEFICTNLRPADRDEVFATRWDDDPFALARDTYAAGEFQWVVWRDGLPVASIGATPLWPGAWQVWAYGTESWDTVALALTKHARRFMMPAISNTDAHRVQCFAQADHTTSRRWLERLGATAECVLDNYGRHGQTFVLYSWHRARTRDTNSEAVACVE